MTIAAAKEKKAVENRVRKIIKESWTTTTIRAIEERLQTLVKSASLQDHMRPRLGFEAQNIAKQNRVVAKARWEAKKLN